MLQNRKNCKDLFNLLNGDGKITASRADQAFLNKTLTGVEGMVAFRTTDVHDFAIASLGTSISNDSLASLVLHVRQLIQYGYLKI
jgi:hypothetical protein